MGNNPKTRCRTIWLAIVIPAALGLALSAGSTSVEASSTMTMKVPCSGLGGGSSGLVAAIAAANAYGTGHTTRHSLIHLIGGCDYDFTTADNGSDGGNALPVITSQIAIDGDDGYTQNALVARDARASSEFRLMDVATDGSLMLEGVDLSGGHAADGASGTTTSAPTDGSPGGAILDTGSLKLESGVVSGNASGGGGSASSGTGASGGFGGDGGGIFASGSATIVDASVSGNVTGNGGDGD